MVKKKKHKNSITESRRDRIDKRGPSKLSKMYLKAAKEEKDPYIARMLQFGSITTAEDEDYPLITNIK